jgi:homeobox protein cut-like
LKEKIGVLTVELEKTKADNVKLYGKIRYVQDYNHEKVVSRGSKRVLHCNSIFICFPDYRSLSFSSLVFFLLNCHFQQQDDLESGFASDVESKYKKIYEDDINPFAAFSKKVVIVELL